MENSDQTPPIPNGKEAVEVAVAAERLRLPASSVERALERGFIEGIRAEDGSWQVLLDKQDNFTRLTDVSLDDGAEPRAANVNQRTDTGTDDQGAETGQQVEASEPAGEPARDVEPIPMHRPADQSTPNQAPEPRPDDIQSTAGREDGEGADVVQGSNTQKTRPSPSDPYLSHLEEEVTYLRAEVLRRDHSGAGKDEAIFRTLDRLADANKDLVQRMPSAESVYAHVERAISNLSVVHDRHDRELTDIKTALAGVREFLAKDRNQP